MHNLTEAPERQLQSALRLLINEWVFRHGILRSELGDAMEAIVRGNVQGDCVLAWPVVEKVHAPSGSIRLVLSSAGYAYAILSGRVDAGYVPHNGLEAEILLASDIEVQRYANGAIVTRENSAEWHSRFGDLLPDP